MSPDESSQVHRTLSRARDGDREAAAELLEHAYGELRRLAATYLGRQRADHTLQPTALVHEAYLKLFDGGEPSWQDRAHFFAVAAKAMREILVDHARRHNADKRRGARERVTLDGLGLAAEATDALALEEILRSLEEWNDRAVRIVELRCFAGMASEDIADVLEVSRATVVRELAAARVWVLRELDRS